MAPTDCGLEGPSLAYYLFVSKGNNEIHSSNINCNPKGQNFHPQETKTTITSIEVD
jgi:hypothetical protein